MYDINKVKNFLAQETGLSTISTIQVDGRVLSSVVNCGVVAHPLDGVPHIALVSGSRAARLKHIRRGSQVTIAVRRGWEWLSVTGAAQLIGPLDLPTGIAAETLRLLLRDIFEAAGGSHDDFDAYDRAMFEEKRVAVLVAAERIIGN